MSSRPLSGTAADTWKATNAHGNRLAAEHRNESEPSGSGRGSTSISLTSPKTKKEQRKMDGGKKRATTVIDDFDKRFANKPKTPKTSKANTA